MRDARRSRGRKMSGDRGDDALVRAVVDVEGITDARGEVIRRTAAPERNATVAGELGVDDHLAAVVERGTVLPAEGGNGGVVEWFGGDHQRVQGSQPSLGLAEGVGVPLGRLHDKRRAQGAVRMRDDALGEPRDRAVFPHPHASCAQDAGKPEHHRKRVDRRAVRAVNRAVRDGDAQMLGHARRRQPLHVVRTQSGIVLGRQLTLQAFGLQCRGCRLHRAAPVPGAVDLLRAQHPLDFVERCETFSVRSEGSFGAEHVREFARHQRKEPAAPTAVATAGTETDAL